MILEFAALTALRVKEPNLNRPYRVPGGVLGTVLLAMPPVVLIGLSVIQGKDEQFAGMSVLTFSLLLALGGVFVYLATSPLRRPPLSNK